MKKKIEYFREKQGEHQISLHFTEKVPFRGTVEQYSLDCQSVLSKEGNQYLADPKVLAIYNLEGIVRFSAFDKYTLSLVKGRAFKWEDLMPKLIPLLETLFGGELVVQLPTEEELEEEVFEDEFDQELKEKRRRF